MITASIVTFCNRAEDLERVLRSALKSPVNHIYLIDHSPADEVKRFFDLSSPVGILLRDPRVSYHRHPNRGFGAGHNVAIRKSMEAGATYHAILNPDIYWDDEVITRLARYMDLHKDVGMIAPKVLYPDGRLQYTCKLLPSPLDLIGRRFLPKTLTGKRNAVFELHASGHDKIMNVPYIHGCFMLMRISELKRAGLFDERFFMYPEDIDITRRLHEVSQTIYYPYVSIYHAHEAASRKFNRMLWIHITNMIRYFNKWGWWRDKVRKEINRKVLESIERGEEKEKNR